jgi:hypothetical protein
MRARSSKRHIEPERAGKAAIKRLAPDAGFAGRVLKSAPRQPLVQLVPGMPMSSKSFIGNT